MKKRLIFIFLICSSFISSMEGYWKSHENSFSYIRAGGYTVLYMPLGAEVAFGHRERYYDWGYGPLINVSVSPIAAPAISLKFESLWYFNRYDGAYVGIMPGVGIANIANEIYSNDRNWVFLPTCELLIGRQFTSYYGTPQFYYFSISPYLSISINYGFGF